MATVLKELERLPLDALPHPKETPLEIADPLVQQDLQALMVASPFSPCFSCDLNLFVVLVLSKEKE